GSFVPIGDGERILASLAGGVPPDLLTVWDWMVVPLGASGALRELSADLDAAGIDADDYLPGIWDYGAYRGAKYGLPTTLNVYGFTWNKDVFAAAGLDRSEEHTSELQSRENLVCRLLLEKKKIK